MRLIITIPFTHNTKYNSPMQNYDVENKIKI